MKAFIVKHLKASWDNAKSAHCYWLKKREGWLSLIIALAFYVPILSLLFTDDRNLGASFGFAGFMTIYSGAIYKDNRTMGIVAAGVILGTAMLQLFFDAWEAFKYGDYIGTAILVIFGIYIGYWSSTMKKGRMPKY